MTRFKPAAFASLSVAAGALILALLATAMTTPVFAEGPNFAPRQGLDPEQACAGDAQRICGQFIPDRAKTGACLRRNKRQLSPDCASFFGGRKLRHRR